MKKNITIIILLLNLNIVYADNSISIGNTSIYQNNNLTSEYVRGVTIDEESMILTLDCYNNLVSSIKIVNIPNLTIETLNGCEILSDDNISLNLINSSAIVTNRRRRPIEFESNIVLEDSSSLVFDKTSIITNNIIINTNSSLEKKESATLTANKIINHDIEVTIPNNVDNTLEWYFGKETNYFSLTDYNYERVTNQYRLSTMTIICIILLLLVELLLIIKKEQLELESQNRKKSSSKKSLSKKKNNHKIVTQKKKTSEKNNDFLDKNKSQKGKIGKYSSKKKRNNP